MLRIKNFDLLAIGMIFLICVFSYGNNIHNEPLLDDVNNITSQDAKLDLKSSIPIRGLFPELKDYHRPFNSFRPLAYLLLLGLHGLLGFNYFAYHYVTIFLFFIYCLAIYYFAREIFKDKNLACLAALLFASHPINTMMVNYIVAGIISIYALLIIASIGLLLKYLSCRKRIFAFLSYLLFFCSLLFHEIAIIGVVYIMMILMFHNKYTIKKAFRIWIPYLVISLFVFWLRPNEAMTVKEFITAKMTNIPMSMAVYAASFCELLFWYCKALVSLKDIVFVYSLQPKEVMVVSALIKGILVLALFLFLFLRKEKEFRVSLAWFLIGFVPLLIAGFTIPALGLTIEPYWFYLSSLGFFIYIAYALLKLKQYCRPGLWNILIFVIILSLSLATRSYNNLMKTEESYVRHWLNVVPKDRRAYYYLATAQAQKKKYKEAIENYNKAFLGDKSDVEIYANLASIYMGLGNIDLARAMLSKAENINAYDSLIYNTRGKLLLLTNDIKSAKESFIKAISLEQYFLLDPRFNLAGIYLEERDFAKAKSLLQEIIKQDKYNSTALGVLIGVYMETKQFAQAVELGKDIYAHNKNSAVLTNIAGLFAEKGYKELAFGLYGKAIKFDRKYVPAYIELGKLYGNINQLDKAIQVWEYSLQLQENEQVKELIAKAQALKNNIIKGKEK